MDRPRSGWGQDGPVSPGAQLGRALGAGAAYLLAGSAAMTLLRVPPASRDLVANVEGSVLALLFGLAALLLYAARWPAGVRWLRPGVLVRATAAYAVCLALWLPFAVLVYPWVLHQLDVSLEPQPALLYFTRPHADRSAVGPFTVVAMACLLVPLAEELLFRGYLQQALKRIAPTWVAVALTSALFGWFHGVAYAVPIGLLGLVFGTLMERFGCLAAAVLAHALHNTITIAAVAAFPEVHEGVYGS